MAKIVEKVNVKEKAGSLKNKAAEFKSFISRGNVVDMAVGVIIGAAFGKIVTSLVNDILMPLIGIVIGGHDFNGLVFTVGTAKIAYGTFIQSVVDFLIVALCIFFVVKLFEKFKKEQKSEPAAKAEDVLLLEEIRDLLKKKTK